VDVVILSWNDGELLDRAVDSALGSQGVDVHVTVVDNGSDPPVDPFLDDRVTLLRNEMNRGVAGGRNEGIRAGEAPIICLLDSDAVLEPTSLATLVDALHDGVACSGPVYVAQAPEASAGAAPTLARKLARVAGRTALYREVPRRPDQHVWDVDFVIGACQVFTRAAYDAVGGIDERYFYGPEDVDFCLRLRSHGDRVVQCADAPVQHPPRRRHRRVLTKAGMRHAFAVSHFLWRHRSFGSRVA
jgi:GT2 family glycosyltransferase